MDLADIRNEVTRVIGLDSTAAGADETLVDQWANEAVVDILLETRCYVAVSTTTLTVNTGDYTLDTAILHVVDLYETASGNMQRLKQVSPQKLIDMRINASASSPASHYAVAGDNLLMIYPTPQSADVVTMYYVPRPTAMTTGTNDPSNVTFGGIPSQFHRAIVKFAEAEAADYRDDKSSANGDRYRSDYLVWLGKIRKYTNQKGSTATVPFETYGSVAPPHDPSTDTGC